MVALLHGDDEPGEGIGDGGVEVVEYEVVEGQYYAYGCPGFV